MITELRGSVPKISITFCPTLINRAYKDIREANLWSFLLYESSWITPPLISTGTMTATQGSTAITFDANAVAAINTAQLLSTYSLITQRQLRSSAAGGIYSIISYNGGTGAAVLDRPYADQSFGAGLSYQLYQLYYPAPFIDHLTYLTITNPSMFLSLDLTATRSTIDLTDPQRSWYEFPTKAVPLGIDYRGQNTATPSSTLGFPLYELWGQPVSPFTYQCYGLRRGTDLVNPGDTLPYQIPQEMVLARAKYYAYEYAEATKDMSPRSSGPDFKFLMAQTMVLYGKLLTLYRKQDKEYCDNWLTNRSLNAVSANWGYYNTISGTAGPYANR
jgi:hypothetical protein